MTRLCVRVKLKLKYSGDIGTPPSHIAIVIMGNFREIARLLCGQERISEGHYVELLVIQK